MKEKKNKYFIHDLICDIIKFKMNIILKTNSDYVFITEYEFINEYKNNILIENNDFDNVYGDGEIILSVHSEFKTPTKKEIYLLEKTMYNILLNHQKIINENIIYLQNTIKKNDETFKKQLLFFLRFEKLKQINKN